MVIAVEINNFLKINLWLRAELPGGGNGTRYLTSGIPPNLGSATLILGFWVGKNSEQEPIL